MAPQAEDHDIESMTAAAEVPSQRASTHDQVSAADIPAMAEWVEERRNQQVGVLVFAGLACVAVILGLVAAIMQNVVIAGAAGLLFVIAIVIRMLLVASTPTKVQLTGSRLTVNTVNVTETFDLAEPLQPVQMTGSPLEKSWQLALTRINGDVVVLTPREVDAQVLAPVVTYYRRMAESLAGDRWATENR